MDIREERMAPRGILPGFGGLDQPEGYAELLDGVVMEGDGSFATPSSLVSLNTTNNPTTIKLASIFEAQGNWYTIVAGPKTLPAVGDTLVLRDLASPALAFTPIDSVFYGKYWGITPTNRNKIYYARNGVPARALRVQYTPSYALIDQPMGVHQVNPSLQPHTKVPSGSGNGDWYFYYVSLMDESGVEGPPYLFYELQLEDPIDPTNPVSLTLVDGFEGTLGGPPDTRTFRAVIYRQGRDVSQPRRLVILNIPAGAVPTTYTDQTTDAQMSLDVMKWDREQPDANVRYFVLHGNRMAAIAPTVVYLSRMSEYENYYTRTYGTDPTGAWPLDIPVVSGEEALGGISAHENLYVFTKSATYIVTGDTYENYRIDKMADVGALNQRCFSIDAKTVWFIGGDRRLYSIAKNQYGNIELMDSGEPIDERLKQQPLAMMEDVELVAHQSLITILLPGVERLILSVKGKKTWTKFSAAVHFTQARALKSPRPSDGLILVNPSGHTISAFRHEYIPGGVAFKSSWGFTSRMYWLGGESRVKHLAFRATFVDPDGTVPNEIILKCYRRNRDGDLDISDNIYQIETPNQNGWCLMEPSESTATAEWFSIVGYGRGEHARFYGFELIHIPERRRELGA